MTEPESKGLVEIKSLIADIKSTYTIQHTTIEGELQNMYTHLKSTLLKQRNEKSDINMALSSEQQINMALLSDRNELVSVITQETTELQQFEAENNDLSDEIKSLKASISKKKFVVCELENECDLLNKKIEFQEQKRLNKESIYREIADRCRAALGFEIVPIKQNVLKVVLDNSYFIIDFGCEQSITNCYPLFLSLERLNGIYKEKENIYEFVKWIRKEFIKCV